MSRRVRVTRTVPLPDPKRVARSLRSPELGPRILFLTGGSAMRGLSRRLKRYTHNSVHLITAFDSGGSSAGMRAAFGMLSVGDLRSRLMALADETVGGNPEIFELFSHRFPKEESQAELAGQFDRLVGGEHELLIAIPDPLRGIVRTHIRCFAEHMPEGFDFRGASIGNIVLVGGYLQNDRDIDAVIFQFSILARVLGVVRPVTCADLHLDAQLEDGTRVVGQHLITGKETEPIRSPIRELRLVDSLEDPHPVELSATPGVLEHLSQAELICFPVGSFWSSVMANLLPAGVGGGVAESGCPKVYIPNAGFDPEQLGMTVLDCVNEIHRAIERDCAREGEGVGDGDRPLGPGLPIEKAVDFVLVDSKRADYGDRLDIPALRERGVEVIDTDLVTEKSGALLDPERLAAVLVSMV